MNLFAGNNLIEQSEYIRVLETGKREIRVCGNICKRHREKKK